MKKINKNYMKLKLFLSIVFRDAISIRGERVALKEKVNRLMSVKTAWEVAGIVWDD